MRNAFGENEVGVRLDVMDSLLVFIEAGLQLGDGPIEVRRAARAAQDGGNARVGGVGQGNFDRLTGFDQAQAGNDSLVGVGHRVRRLGTVLQREAHGQLEVELAAARGLLQLRFGQADHPERGLVGLVEAVHVLQNVVGHVFRAVFADVGGQNRVQLGFDLFVGDRHAVVVHDGLVQPRD